MNNLIISELREMVNFVEMSRCSVEKAEMVVKIYNYAAANKILKYRPGLIPIFENKARELYYGKDRELLDSLGFRKSVARLFGSDRANKDLCV